LVSKSIFVTGATGFLGRHLLAKLEPARYPRVFCLSRKDPGEVSRLSAAAQVRFVRGGLFDPAAYEKELAASDTVLHLAAATGKATRAEHFRVNVEGTRLLVERCRSLDVRRFLYVSSIAARFPKKTHYHYAQAKQEAEEIVRAGGFDYTIIRPTIILGPGAPVWQGFKKLAQFAVIPIPGDGRTRIQPIDVDDLADLLLRWLDSGEFCGETLELGGPETISIEEFLCRAHRHLRRTEPRTLHLPLSILLPLLTILEVPFYSRLPVTVGQLGSFRCDGTIKKNRLFEEHVARMKTLEEMLALLCTHDPA